MARYYYAADARTSAASVERLPNMNIDSAVGKLAAAGLSAREIEVVRLLIEGKSYQAIADQLFISVNTVKAHIRSIYPKLQVKSRHEIVHFVVARMHSE
jgi:DNA-binding CsgD family transcriptional regulator